jgi:uncharacterized membrane protein
MTCMLRKLSGFLAAPLPAAVLQSTVVSFWPKIGKGVFEHPSSMFVIVCLYFYLFGLILGGPAWLVMRRRNPEMRYYVALGTMVGIVPIAAALVVMASRNHASAYLVIYDLLFFGLGGALSGALFWRISVREPSGVALRRTFG